MRDAGGLHQDASSIVVNSSPIQDLVSHSSSVILMISQLFYPPTPQLLPCDLIVSFNIF